MIQPLFKIRTLFIKAWWGSWWGQAMIHASFDKYKRSVLFCERSRIFSPIEATKMFKFQDFKFFYREVLKDKNLMFTILFRPVRILRELREKDYALKRHVELG